MLDFYWPIPPLRPHVLSGAALLDVCSGAPPWAHVRDARGCGNSALMGDLLPLWGCVTPGLGGCGVRGLAARLSD